MIFLQMDFLFSIKRMNDQEEIMIGIRPIRYPWLEFKYDVMKKEKDMGEDCKGGSGCWDDDVNDEDDIIYVVDDNLRQWQQEGKEIKEKV